MAGLVTAFGSGAMTNSIPDLEQADCILVTGSNTTETHPIIGTRLLRAQRRGARLIVADPRRIQIARCADLHLRQRPGSDIAWLNGMMRVLIEDGLVDEGFIADRTEGFEELETAVAEYTPERVEEITGVSREDLIRAAHWFGKAERAAIVYAMGITQHASGVQHVWACANLAMLTGNVGRPGTGVNPLRGQNNVQGACDMGALPNVFPGYQSVADPEIRDEFARAWNVQAVGGRDGPLRSSPGLTETEMLSGAARSRVQAMYIVGENPMVSEPEANRVRQVLEALEFLLVQDVFLSQTAELADVVLPAAVWAEKDGTFTATDRRVQRVRKAVEPPGEAKPDWQIICELAGRMAPEPGWSYSDPSEVMDEIASLTPIYAGVSYARLEQLGYLQWPCRNAADPGTPYLHKDGFARGRGRFHVVHHKEAEELPDDEYPLLLTTGRLLFQYHSGTLSRRSPKLEQEAGACSVEINPVDARATGLGVGQQVRVWSRRGAIEAWVRITDRVEPGVVFIPFHFAEAAANVLTNPALDPKAKIPEYKVCAVRIEPAS